ncbi:unnamed protein product [Linum trigynum]|uniref:Uncharacterized protein n=1 Tax=Linum trigynum TaxID=586398 RepID=A0AAV2E5C0_9ROSI
MSSPLPPRAREQVVRGKLHQCSEAEDSLEDPPHPAHPFGRPQPAVGTSNDEQRASGSLLYEASCGANPSGITDSHLFCPVSGGIITRISHHFGVDVKRSSIIGRTEPSLTQLPARAPSRRWRLVLRCTIPPPAAASSSRAAGDPLVQRMDRLETHVVGVTSCLDRQTDLLEKMARR